MCHNVQCVIHKYFPAGQVITENKKKLKVNKRL